jgi:hypothetical protein
MSRGTGLCTLLVVSFCKPQDETTYQSPVLTFWLVDIECLQYVIWDLSPVMSSQDIRSPIPSDEARWGSATADQWDQETQRLHGKQSYSAIQNRN